MMKNPGSSESIFPVMLSKFIAAVVDRACQLGANTDNILSGTLLRANVLSDGDAVIPSACVYRAAENAARLSGNRFLCAEVSQEFDWFSGLKLPSYVRSLPSLGDLMIAWLKHTNRVQHSTRFEMVVGVDTTIIRGIRLWPTPHPTGQADAWDISAWVKVFTERMDRQWDSNYVAARVSDPGAIPPAMLPPESVVKGDKDYTEFRFPNDWLLAEASIVKDANPNPVDEKLPTHDLATIFTQFNFSDFPNIEGFGKFLGYEPKTLQRRFSDLGTSFSKLVDHARQVQALTLLERGDTQIQEISAALGYQNASAFNRAFFRWQGMSPKEWCIRVKDADQA